MPLLISVLSAVAEIERENIIEQTMNGRKEKARQGGWNGGFAPCGYYLKDKQLYIQKIKRANGTLSQWSTHFVRMIIDNPVYSGKIAFGRLTREKVKGTKNEYRQVQQDEYIIADGQQKEKAVTIKLCSRKLTLSRLSLMQSER